MHAGIQQHRSALPHCLPVRRLAHRGHQAKAGFPRIDLVLLFAVLASPASFSYRVIATAMGALRAPRPPDAPPRSPAAAVIGVGAPTPASSTGFRPDPLPPSLLRLCYAVSEVPVVTALFLVVQRRTSVGSPASLATARLR
ncbi:hypothetical protein D1007_10235 [Hordeum vulgare]|nr:hypothetical protein D1007_10235 [Hordeum vulgare]